MGQGGRDSGVAVPEQWGELPGDPGQGSGRGASSLPPARSTHPPARRTTAPPLEGAAPAAADRPVTVGVITPFLDGSFWNPVLMGLHASAQERGLRTLVLRGTPSEVQAPSLAREQVDGWIVVIELLAPAGKRARKAARRAR